MKLIYNQKHRLTLLLLCSALSISGCKKFVEVDPPTTTTNAGNVYNNDANATAVLTSIYSNMSADENNLAGIGQLNLAPSLSSDELTLFEGVTSEGYLAYYKNALRSNTPGPANTFWNKLYKLVFLANSAIEGLNGSESLTISVKQQLLGEAYFIRAFAFFYLVNLHGDVPLTSTTDYKVNASMSRTSSEQVYAQIIDDLLNAQNLLAEEYRDGSVMKSTEERVRPNKYAATALLARTYLYTQDWQNAEVQSSLVIQRNDLYDTVPLTGAFLMNSKETIWALQPVGINANANTGSGRLFILPNEGPDGLINFVYLNEVFVKSFEAGDLRSTEWINSITSQGITYYYPAKYKIGAVTSSTKEYPIVLRVAEQYLIRAEARAQQNKLSGANSAQSDLDIIRLRAGLNGTIATTQSDLLSATLTERKHELFTEWGHRWFDLRRTKTIDTVMTSATAIKGGAWNVNSALYPIPVQELLSNPKLIQNPGY